MDPVTVVAAALSAGAAAGMKDSASVAAQHAYAGLRDAVVTLVRERVADPDAAVAVLRDRTSGRAALSRVLADVGAADNEAILTAARELLALVDPAGVGVGRYAADPRGARGVPGGHGHVQINHF